MRLTQGTFSFLPDLSDTQIRDQIQYCLDQGWALSIEHTDDPHPRNTYWEMFGNPMFDLHDAAGVMAELASARASLAGRYIKVNAFDATHGVESLRLSFITDRPEVEPGFGLVRSEGEGRHIRYTIHSYAAERPPGERYGA